MQRCWPSGSASTPDLTLVRAASYWERLVGLIGRTHLPPDEGFVIEPCGSIHTFFMRMPIDVLFLDAQGAVLRTVANVRPWRAYVGCAKARSVVELAAGTIERRGIKVGDRIGP